MTVGQRLVEERKRLGMSQGAFYEACGASRAAQYNFESDINLPGGAYLIAAAALGVDVSYVLTGVRNPAIQSDAVIAKAEPASSARSTAVKNRKAA